MAGQNPLEQIKTFFTRYTLQQKLALAGSAALVLILLWVLVYFVNRVEYQTLYADLDPQEAQGIIQKLQELKVPYELEPDGRTVKDRKSTRLNSSHVAISYAVFCLKKKT